MDDTDALALALAEQIDRSFGAGPAPQPPTETLLARGRRARRRRRATVAGAAVAAAVLIGSTAVLATSGSDRPARSDDGFVASPDPTTGPTTDPTTGPTTGPTTDPTTDPQWFQTQCAPCTPYTERERLLHEADRAAEFDGEGDVTLASGAVELGRVDNPYSLVSPQWSLALAVGYRGEVFWYSESGSGDGGSGGTVGGPRLSTTDFTDFVAEADPRGRVRMFVGPDVWPQVSAVDPVTMAADSARLQPTDGFTVVEQRAGVDVGHAWADRTDTTAAALVRADDGGEYYVLARRFDGKPAQFVTVPQADHGADLDAFLDLARTRYATADQ